MSWICLRPAEIDSSVAGLSAWLMTMRTIVIEISARSFRDGCFRIGPLRHSWTRTRLRQSTQITNSRPVLQLILGAALVGIFLVEIACLRPDRKQHFLVLMTFVTLIRVGDHVTEIVNLPGCIRELDRHRIGDELECCLALRFVPDVGKRKSWRAPFRQETQTPHPRHILHWFPLASRQNDTSPRNPRTMVCSGRRERRDRLESTSANSP